MNWLTEWLKWCIIPLIILIVFKLGQSYNWEWISFSLILSGIANAFIGIYIFLGGSGADHLRINEHFFRAFGTFGQPNPFGGFMGMLIPLALMLSLGYLWRFYSQWKQQNRWRKSTLIWALYYLFSTIILTLGIITSWSRGAWLAIIIALFASLFTFIPRLKNAILISGIGLFLLGILWFSGLIPASIVNRFSSATQEYFVLYDVRGEDISTENYAVIERLAHWQAALNMSNENPLLGIGFGNYANAYPNYRLINWKEPLGHAHNYYLNILAETGIIGALSYGVLWVSILAITWLTRSHPDLLIRAAISGLMGTWVYLSVHSLLDNLYVNNLFLHIGLMLGLLSLFFHQIRNSIPVR
ncbi:hypothetical protein MASR2M15_17310 [Anaerolineales bacterium]